MIKTLKQKAVNIKSISQSENSTQTLGTKYFTSSSQTNFDHKEDYITENSISDLWPPNVSLT